METPNTIEPPKVPQDKKRKKITLKEKNERRDMEIADLAKSIYIKWKGREIHKENPAVSILECEKRAAMNWDAETDDVTQAYFKTALMENVLLGEETYMFKKKKAEGSKRKEEWHPYLLFCKEHREELRSQNVSGNDVMTILSEKWKALPEEERARYAGIAKENKRRDLGDEEDEAKKMLETGLEYSTLDPNGVPK